VPPSEFATASRQSSPRSSKHPAPVERRANFTKLVGKKVPLKRPANPDLDRATYITCFCLMLERCDPNIRPDRFGQTILHEVAVMGNHVRGDETVAFAKLLLSAGARMDVRDDLLRSTPLGWACRWGRPELVKLLLERGADPVEPEAEPSGRGLSHGRRKWVTTTLFECSGPWLIPHSREILWDPTSRSGLQRRFASTSVAVPTARIWKGGLLTIPMMKADKLLPLSAAFCWIDRTVGMSR